MSDGTDVNYPQRLVKNQVWDGSKWVPMTQPEGSGGGEVTGEVDANVTNDYIVTRPEVWDEDTLAYVPMVEADDVSHQVNISMTNTETRLGALDETAPATDTASSGLNGRLQRVAQRLTSLIALLPTSLGAGGGLKVDGSGTALPVSGTVAVTGVATLAEQQTQTAALGSPFQAGGTIGNTAFGATQSGTWTVQPGNTANSTAWLVTGTGGTFPVTIASVPSHAVTNAGTFAVQVDGSALTALQSLKATLSVVAVQATGSGDTTLIASGTRKIKRVEAANTHASTALTVGL